MPKGENMDYRKHWGQARAMQIVQKITQSRSRVDEERGCILYTGACVDEKYPQVKRWSPLQERQGRPGKMKNWLLSRLAFVARTGESLGTSGHASHLCNQPQCFNPGHIVNETNAANQDRKGCQGEVWCIPCNNLIINLCVHNPHCVLPRKTDVNCCRCVDMAQIHCPEAHQSSASPCDSVLGRLPRRQKEVPEDEPTTPVRRDVFEIPDSQSPEELNPSLELPLSPRVVLPRLITPVSTLPVKDSARAREPQIILSPCHRPRFERNRGETQRREILDTQIEGMEGLDLPSVNWRDNDKFDRKADDMSPTVDSSTDDDVEMTDADDNDYKP